MKYCWKCKTKKNNDKFLRNSHKDDGLSSECKKCTSIYRKLRKNKVRKVVLSILLKSKCVECPENDPVVLEFDHVRGKKIASINDLIQQGASLKTVLREIAKCDIRCANCHRRKTSKSNKSFRIAL